MQAGDLCLSVIPASAGDSGLFLREAYLRGAYEPWRLPLLGREETAALIQSQYSRVMPAMGIAYAGMLLLIIGNAFAVLTKKTALPRRMLVFHMLVWQIILVLIPDIRQLLGAEIST